MVNLRVTVRSSVRPPDHAVGSEAMRIGELARMTDCRSATLRHYEREGLLPAPARTAGNYRRYDKDHLQRVSFIRRCRSLDMTLAEIRTLLTLRDSPEMNCAAVNALLDQHIEQVGARLAELKALERQLKGLRRRCVQPQVARSCGILSELAASG